MTDDENFDFCNKLAQDVFTAMGEAVKKACPDGLPPDTPMAELYADTIGIMIMMLVKTSFLGLSENDKPLFAAYVLHVVTEATIEASDGRLLKHEDMLSILDPERKVN